MRIESSSKTARPLWNGFFVVRVVGTGGQWGTACTTSITVGSRSVEGTCYYDPSAVGTYCFMLRVKDRAGNQFTTDGTTCGTSY